MVFHPSWGYFAARYDIEQISIEIEGKEPKPNELLQLVEEAKKHNIKIDICSTSIFTKKCKNNFTKCWCKCSIYKSIK